MALWDGIGQCLYFSSMTSFLVMEFATASKVVATAHRAAAVFFIAGGNFAFTEQKKWVISQRRTAVCYAKNLYRESIHCDGSPLKLKNRDYELDLTPGAPHVSAEGYILR
jgi:hypothetical protein